jgi:hypothetical protein
MTRQQVLIFGILLMVCGVTTAAPTAPYSLTIATEKDTVTSGTPVVVSVTVTNTSNTDITFFDAAPECDYQVEIRDSTGNLVPDTPHKRELAGCKDSPRGRNILVRLKPGESYGNTPPILVSGLGDMAAPQKYTVQFLRKIPELSPQSVKSQPLGVTVTE